MPTGTWWASTIVPRLLPDLMGIWSADADIAHIATLFAGELLDGALKGYGAYAIVAHSMGGLVAQQALLARPELARRTTHLVMFGTPKQRAEEGALRQPPEKPQARDMQALARPSPACASGGRRPSATSRRSISWSSPASATSSCRLPRPSSRSRPATAASSRATTSR